MVEWVLGHKSPFQKPPESRFFWSPLPGYSILCTDSGPTHAWKTANSFTNSPAMSNKSCAPWFGRLLPPNKTKLDSWYWHRCRWEVTNNPGSLAVVTQSISSWPSFFGAPWSACAPGMSNQQILQKLHQKIPPSPWVPPLSLQPTLFFGCADGAVSAFLGFQPIEDRASFKAAFTAAWEVGEPGIKVGKCSLKLGMLRVPPLAMAKISTGNSFGHPFPTMVCRP